MNTLFSICLLLSNVVALPVVNTFITETPSVIPTDRPSLGNMSRSLGNITINEGHTHVHNWYNTTSDNTPSPEWAARQEMHVLIITWVVVTIVATWIIMTPFWCFWGNHGLWARARHVLRGGGNPSHSEGDRDLPLRELQLARRAGRIQVGPSSVTTGWPRSPK